MVVSLRGFDSVIADAYVRSNDGGLEKLMYDSDGSGGNAACVARISLVACRSGLRPEGKGSDVLDCDPVGPRAIVCDEDKPDAGS